MGLGTLRRHPPYITVKESVPTIAKTPVEVPQEPAPAPTAEKKPRNKKAE